MRAHLTDREMTELISDTLEGTTVAHLRECATCRREYARLHAAFVDFAMDARAQAQRPEAFFQRQRVRIGCRVGDRRPSIWRRRSVWASALATGALVAVFLTRGGTPPRSPADTETDQALLSAVQHAIYREAPVALSPAALLIADMERGGRQPN
jgi:hypothetical protein